MIFVVLGDLEKGPRKRFRLSCLGTSELMKNVLKLQHDRTVVKKHNRMPVWSHIQQEYGFGSPVPRQPAHLHTQADSDSYLRDSSRVPRRRLYTVFIIQSETIYIARANAVI